MLLAIGAAAPVWAQPNPCIDCHVTRRTAASVLGRGVPEAHVRDWAVSAHAKAGVGCDRCHGGNTATFEPGAAHRGILRWMNPASPINRMNVPRTCGRCHGGPFAAFQKSRHFALLQGQNPVAPTCTTCHGAAGDNRPTPAALERECATCHRPGRPDEQPQHPAMGRQMLQGVRDARSMLQEARSRVGGIRDRARRVPLEQAAQRIDVTLSQATQAGHAFVYGDLEERLNSARRQLASLFQELGDPIPAR
jgi:hypothetical protein